MNKKLIIGMIVITGLIIGIFASVRPLLFNEFQKSDENAFGSLAIHYKRKDSPITIDGNDDFAQQAKRMQWPGDGSESKPYIIENIELTTSIVRKGNKPVVIPDAAVSISNTTVYFILQNNWFYDTVGSIDGIVLWNVTHGMVIHNTILNYQNGILLYHSGENTVEWNKIVGVVSTSLSKSTIKYKISGTAAIRHGIFLDPSNENQINFNLISNFTGTGIYVFESSFNSIYGNIIETTLGENGIFLNGSHENILDSNEISASQNSGLVGTQIRMKISGTAAIRHGIFLDPSNKNIIRNNIINDFTGSGLYLLNSSNNQIASNDINNSFGENGLFLVGSDYNTITDNDIYASNTSTYINDFGIRMRVAGTAAIRHGIFLDPSNNNTITNNRIYNQTGNGLYLQDSADNDIFFNEISNNDGNGVFLENSMDTEISNNVVFYDDSYGINLDSGSNGNLVTANDFIENNVGSSQLRDDGYGNSFTSNFLVDHDNTDNDGNTYSDYEYEIDGNAESFDIKPKSFPVQDLSQLKFHDIIAIVDYESETFNLNNEGNYETVKIQFPESYSVTNINVTTVCTDNEIPAEEPQVHNIRTLIVKFNRPLLVDYLKSILDLNELPLFKDLNVTGRLNGDFMGFYGNDTVKIVNSQSADQIDFLLAKDPVSIDSKYIQFSYSMPALSLSCVFSLPVTATILRRRLKAK